MSLRPFALIAGSLALVLCTAGCPGESSPPQQIQVDDGQGDGGGSDTAKTPPPAAKPFDRASAKSPWKDVKVGDWAVYKMITAGKEMRFEVTKVEGNAITFTVKDTATGELMNEPTVDLEEEESRYKDPMSYDALAKDKDGNEIKPYTEAVEVNGKKIDALVLKRADGRGATTELWMAEKDVPPFNQCAVKSIRNGKLELELVDFGRGGS